MTAVIYVSPTGDDHGSGAGTAPLRTIGAAALLALPGDTIEVSAGTYRERVDPPRGGAGAHSPITYRAAAGEHVVITGSDLFTTWTLASHDVWELIISSAYFNDFNPYAEVVHGDWFNGHGRRHRRGNVYLNGSWLPEAATPEALLAGSGLAWVSRVDGLVDREPTEYGGPEGRDAYAPASYDPAGNTTIWARFPVGTDPNDGSVEVGVRATVFTPTREHIDFITVRGFELRNAATNWAAPTAGQEGLITPYWSRGWVIEDNEICYSRCAGIALAKNRDEFDGERGTTDGYYLTIVDALGRNGWSKETVGSHTITNNHIHHCGQVGIVGSLGCAFSTITNNEIHDCNSQGIWSGAEMAGIKLHGAIDVVISGNHLYRCGEPAAIWLDWMAQGATVTGNFLHDNVRDLFTEVNHGPIVIANNVSLSPLGLLTNSRGVVLAHNLMLGALDLRHDDRETPYLAPHSTELVQMRRVCSVGDMHLVNNIFSSAVDLAQCEQAIAEQPCTIRDNVWLGSVQSHTDFGLSPVWFEKVQSGWFLSFEPDPAWALSTEALDLRTLGPAVVPNQPYEPADGSAVRSKGDYFAAPRGPRVSPGPFEPLAAGLVQVWPR